MEEEEVKVVKDEISEKQKLKKLEKEKKKEKEREMKLLGEKKKDLKKMVGSVDSEVITANDGGEDEYVDGEVSLSESQEGSESELTKKFELL
jgi:hypothetical protein